MATAGLAGIEIDHPDQAPADRAELRRLADELDLIVTGSSDYHGSRKTQGLGAETTAPAQLDRLLLQASGRGVVTDRS
jgi:sugar phosphate isomerase/epimerase